MHRQGLYGEHVSPKLEAGEAPDKHRSRGKNLSKDRVRDFQGLTAEEHAAQKPRNPKLQTFDRP